MSLVATLISHPARRSISQPLAKLASQKVAAAAADWLADNVACDLALPAGLDTPEALTTLREAVASEPVDVVARPGGVSDSW